MMTSSPFPGDFALMADSASAMRKLLYSLTYYAHLLSRSNRMKKHRVCLKFSYDWSETTSGRNK
jgi:hypothetical protein